MSYQHLVYEVNDGIHYIGLGHNEKKSLTVLTEASLEELSKALDAVELDRKAKGLVIHSVKPGVFLAGMDVEVIKALNSEMDATNGCERGQALFNRIEDLKCPSLALVDGPCLGGGLELALSCKKIICSDNNATKLGLPEVMLGVLPGFGGTYRLPKKIGLTASLDLLLTGKQLDSRKAKKLGLVEFVMPKERLLALASEYLFKKDDSKKTSLSESLAEAASDNFIARKVIFQKAREKVLSSTKGFYPAPLKILDHLESSYGKKRSSYLASEAKAFGELSQTSQSKSLQHIFFLQDNAKKLPLVDDLKKVETAAVLGAGVMGGGIAWLLASSGQKLFMKDISVDGLNLGLKQASSVFSKAVARKKMTQDEFERSQRSIQPTLTYDGFRQVDLVVEAIVENMKVKKTVLSEVEKEVPLDCLITTNTSSLSVSEMSQALEHPERFAGLHFFNPVNKMPLVEIVRHDKVSEKTLHSLYQWALKAKKTPVIVGDCPGFLVNRILAPFLNETAYLLEEGVSIKDIDKAVLNFGMPMGACRLMDEIGLDVCMHVGEVMEKGLGGRLKANSLSHKAVAEGLLGKKVSKGFYLYDESEKETEINPAMEKYFPEDKIQMDETNIQMRLFLPMINEAANILEERIVEDAATVDLALIFGIGFPPFKGGLLRYADSQGLDKIATAINRFANNVNADRYNLSPYLQNLVTEKKKFYD